MCKFCGAKNFMQNFLSEKRACKNKSSKIFGYLVRVHNDKGLELQYVSGKAPAWYKTGTSRRKLWAVRQRNSPHMKSLVVLGNEGLFNCTFPPA